MTTDQIQQLLTGPTQEGGIDLGDGAYIDWSTTDEDGLINFEAGDGEDAVIVPLTRDQLVGLYRSIGVWLIQNPQH